MPMVHRDTDLRFCGAQTIVELQKTVLVNFLLWAVQGDIDTHCFQGQLIAVYPPRNVYINFIPVICAPGDHAAPDLGDECCVIHPLPLTWPAKGSTNTYVYSGAGGG